MPANATVEMARPDELATALRLVFRSLDNADRERRVTNALKMIAAGEFDAAGVLVHRDRRHQVDGAMVCQPLAGGGGLVWPPFVNSTRATIEAEDQLVRLATTWLRQRGARLAQAILGDGESVSAAPLLRNGFDLITTLVYLRHDLDLPLGLLTAPERLHYESFADVDQDLFGQTLLATYDGTLDCPEVNGVRSIDEVITGHRAQGRHDPRRWWLARASSEPVGVLLLTDVGICEGWDLSYLGVVPQARRRGLGKELLAKALFEAKAAEAGQLTLAVDKRNQPAVDLYRQAGFTEYDRRAIYLFLA
jgi:ribosomal protein S18 acetylase RimI-like enzyme